MAVGIPHPAAAVFFQEERRADKPLKDFFFLFSSNIIDQEKNLLEQ